MIYQNFICVIILLGLFSFGELRKLPSYITPCRQSDPALNDCIVQQFEKIRPQLKKGIPEFDLPSMDPLNLPTVSMNHGNGAAVSFKADFTNLIVTGASDVVVKKVDLDLNKLKLKVHVYFPKLRIESDYKISGKILVLPISGDGHSDGNFTNIETKMVVSGDYEMRDGKRYIVINDKKVSLAIGDSKLYFANLFNGNKELSESTNQLINENSKDIVQEITPLVEETIGELVHKIVNQVFNLFPVDELLLPN